MTVQEFMEMFIDPDVQKFELWDNEKEEVIFCGYLSEAPDELLDAEVTSIDTIEKGRDVITLNIDVE